MTSQPIRFLTLVLRFGLAAGWFCLHALSARAAIIPAGNASYAAVSAAVALASRGDTVTVPAGSAVWGNILILSKGISLIGAGRNNTILTGNGVLVSIVPDGTAIANEETIRVEGFTFDGNNAALNLITVAGAGATSNKPFKNLAIGNNTFRNMLAVTSASGVISTTGQLRGAIFRNIFDRCNVILKIMGNDDPMEWLNGNFPQSYGTADNLFFEDNTIQWSTTYSGGDPGWTEIGQGARCVIRYNTWDQANALAATEVWDIHGFQNWPGNGQTGTMVAEYYGNTLVNIGTYRVLNHRGGWGLFFNNIITGPQIGDLEVNQYAAGDPGGSGCTVDVPGAPGHFICEINNTYTWNNTGNGAIMNIVPGPIGNGCGISENNGYWNYNPAFNGTTGIGRGTTPPSGPCTIGVAYWTASTATPTTDPNIIQNGHLYKCLTTNVWTDYYTPYAYPHPLATGNPTPSPTPTPASTPTATATATPTPTATATATATPTATPTPTPTPTPTATPTGDISFPAASGIITSPFVINGDLTISQPVQTLVPAQGGRALYTFNVTTPGDYVMLAMVNCPDDGSNSFFINIDAEPSTAMVWHIPVTSGLESRTVTWSPDTEPKVWTLNAGVHQLIIRGREANARLGQITLRVGSPPPTPTPTATSTPTATPTPDQCEVPNFIGANVNHAQAIWNDAGFTTEVIILLGPNNWSDRHITWQSLPEGFIGSCSDTTIIVQ
jgi:hypothetical protein